MSHPLMRRIVALAVFCSGCTGPLQSNGPGTIANRSLRSGGREYPFSVFLPSTYTPAAALPSLLLIHGAGGNGPDILEYWRSFAETHRIILVAPTLDLSADAESDVPVAFPRIMDAVGSEWRVDPGHRYVFGYSAGGYFAYDAALLNADYFAGAAIFASIIQPTYDSIVTKAPRLTAVAIYLGDHDQYFSLQEGRRTRDLLLSHGMDVHYVELVNHDHSYEPVATLINEDAWTFLSSHARP